MSERINTNLREAKPREGGMTGLILSLLGWLKNHIPFVIRPVQYVDQRIKHERACTRLVDAQARILEAEAQRRELENEEFSARGIVIGQMMAAHLLSTPRAITGEHVPAEALSLKQAAAALRTAAERLQELGIDVRVSLTSPARDQRDSLVAQDPDALPAAAQGSEREPPTPDNPSSGRAS